MGRYLDAAQRQGSAIRVLAAVVAVLLVAEPLSGCARRSTPATPTVWQLDGTRGGRHTFPGGLEINLPPNALPQRAKVTVGESAIASRAASTPLTPPSGADPATASPPVLVSRAFAIDAGPDRLAKPVGLRAPADLRRLGRGKAVAYFATFDQRSGRWQPFGGVFDPAAGTVAVTTQHFSIWGVFAWTADRVKETLYSIASHILGPAAADVAQLACDSPPADARVDVTPDGDRALMACPRREADGVAVQVRNGRAFTLSLTLPGGSTAELDTRGDLALELRRLLGRFTGEHRVLVPSGSTATIHLPLRPGSSATLQSFPDAGAYLFDSLRVAITMYTLVAGGFATPAPGQFSAGWWAGKLERALSHGMCGYSLLGHDGRNIAGVGLTPALAGRLAKEAFDCIGQLAEDSVGAALGVVIGIVAGLINGVVVGGQFILDSLQGKAYRAILVTVKAAPSAPGDAPPSSGAPAPSSPAAPGSSPPPTRPTPPGPVDRFAISSYDRLREGARYATWVAAWQDFAAKSNTITRVGINVGNNAYKPGSIPQAALVRLCPDAQCAGGVLASGRPQINNYGATYIDLGDVAVTPGAPYFLRYDAPPPVPGGRWVVYYFGATTYEDLSASVVGYNR